MYPVCRVKLDSDICMSLKDKRHLCLVLVLARRFADGQGPEAYTPWVSKAVVIVSDLVVCTRRICGHKDALVRHMPSRPSDHLARGS